MSGVRRTDTWAYDVGDSLPIVSQQFRRLGLAGWPVSILDCSIVIGRPTWFLRKVTADDVGRSFGSERRLLRRRALRCQPVITFALWQRAMTVVQSFVVQTSFASFRAVS